MSVTRQKISGALAIALPAAAVGLYLTSPHQVHATGAGPCGQGACTVQANSEDGPICAGIGDSDGFPIDNGHTQCDNGGLCYDADGTGRWACS